APEAVQVGRGLEVDRSLDRSAQLQHVRDEVEKRRSANPIDPVALGQALMQLGILEQSMQNTESAVTAFREARTLHGDSDHWKAREAGLRLEVLAQLEQFPPGDRASWQRAIDLFDQSRTLHAQGRYRDAIERAEESLALRRHLWGNEHLETAESLVQLAALSIEHADFYLRAEGLASEAADRVKMALGTRHPAYGDCQYVLARLGDDRADFAGTEGLYEEALSIYRRSVGELSSEFARALNRQGRMHNVWWKDYGAGKTFRAQQIRDQVCGREHIDSAESLEDLAEVAYSLRNFPRAEDLLRDAIRIREASQGPDHPDLARPQSLLAASMAAHGDVSQAEVNIHRALNVTERCRGRRHPCWAQQRLLMAVLQIRSAYDYAGG